ncbi:MAG: hypothetical protein ACK4V6_08060 [Microthrixaceae bacterium]
MDELREHRTPAAAIRWLRCTATVLVVGLAGTACASHSNTTQASPAEPTPSPSVPTTSIVRSRATTTTVAPRPAVADVGADPTSQLTSVLAQLAAAPELAGQLGGLDTSGIAGLLGIDPGVLGALGLSPAQIQQLAAGVLAAPASTQAQLIGGTIDPQALLGILAGSLDLETLAGGAVSDVVGGVLAALGGISLSPELVINLGDLFDELDLEALDPIAATPANAALLALITSAWLGSNPLLAEQLLGSPLLDPILRELLEQLRLISDTLGNTARDALLELLYSLVPGLRPPTA